MLPPPGWERSRPKDERCARPQLCRATIRNERAGRSALSGSSLWSLRDHFGMRASCRVDAAACPRLCQTPFSPSRTIARGFDLAKELVQGEGRHEQNHLRGQIPLRERYSVAIISVIVAIASRVAGVITAPGSACTDRLIRNPNTGRRRSRTSWLMPRLPHRPSSMRLMSA